MLQNLLTYERAKATIVTAVVCPQHLWYFPSTPLALHSSLPEPIARFTTEKCLMVLDLQEQQKRRYNTEK